MEIKFEFIDDYSAAFTQVGSHDEEELIALGQQKDTDISLELDALSCLRFFPHVTNLILRPGQINKDHLRYLYVAPIKRLKLDYYSYSIDEYAIDLEQFLCLESIFSRTEFNFINNDKSTSIKSIVIQQWLSGDLQYLDNQHITKLKLLSGKLVSLRGIKHLHNLRCLSISNQRLLNSVSEIEECCNLEFLEIESCNKLTLDVIPTIPSLRSLVIIGRQRLANCAFFFRFPRLERLILGIKIVDGDISFLLNLKHCSILTDCRHYSHRNAELPKAERKTD